MQKQIELNGLKFVLYGRWLKVARLQEEWLDSIDDPYQVLEALSDAGEKVDLLCFWQTLPEVEPRFPFYRESEDVAAIPVTTYEHWLGEQVTPKTRAAIRKAGKKGVVIRTVELDDQFVQGVHEILNESPVRQGRPFVHYGRSLSSIRSELEENAHRSIFIGAYVGEELIGYIQMIVSPPISHTFGLVSKMAHRDKSSQNALLAKAVEVSAEMGVEYAIHGFWIRGGLEKFKKSNGFERYPMPRYYIPLTFKGRLILMLRLHHGWKGVIPEPVKDYLIRIRAKKNELKYSRKETPPAGGRS